MDGRSLDSIRTEALTEKKPRKILRGFSVSVSRRHQVRVRIRIMKLSKLNSATCIQARESLR